MRLNRSPNRFLRFRYRSLIILNLFKLPITFSFTTRSEAISRFCRFSSAVSGCLLLDFFGSFEFDCHFFMPVYPLSVTPERAFVHRTRLSLNNLKSRFFPLQNEEQLFLFSYPPLLEFLKYAVSFFLNKNVSVFDLFLLSN